jgi:hypothetical protein
VSWVANAASGRPIYGDRFNTGNIERALLSRGFKYGTQPGALNVGWNGGHTAATLPDGTPVSSGEGGGVRIGGGGAYQRQFGHHMYLPTAPEDLPPAPDGMPAPDPAMPFMPPPPEMVPPPAPEAPVQLMAQDGPMPPPAPAPELAPPPADPFAPPPPADLPAPA